MADKLAESTWTGFTKKQKLELEDKALLKALGAFEKAENGKPEARLAALAELVEQIKKQVVALAKVKKQLGDKPFGVAKDKLYELLDAAEKLQKDTRQEADAATAAPAGKKDGVAEDEEEDSPALLTTTMTSLVRLLHKGEVSMHAMIAVGSKRVAVLIMRRAVSSQRRKLLSEYLELKTGLRYLLAEVTGAKGVLTFALDGPPGGIAKLLRQALLDQTGLRTKVFVKFGEETETAEDDEVEAAAAAESAAGSSGKAAAPSAAAGVDPKSASAGAAAAPAPAADDAKVAVYIECRDLYAKARSQLRSNLKRLEQTVTDMCTLEAGYDVGDAAERAASVYRVLDVLDERLLQTLDRAVADPARRDQLEQEALDIVDTYLAYATGDPLVAAVDDNGFVAVGIRRNVVDALTEVARRL